jgi:uncharacterized membrane protein
MAKKGILIVFLKRYWFLISVILIYSIYFSVYSILRYRYFSTGIFDLGNMNQTLWNTLHGHFFMETDPTGSGKLVSRISDHADFLLLLITPLYMIFSSPRMLLILQAVVVALGAIPVFLYTQEKTKSSFYPSLFAVLYLLMPSVEHPNLFDFHAVTLSMTPILFSFYFLYKRRYKSALPFIILSLMAKEEVGFTICIMVLYFFLRILFPKVSMVVPKV